MKPGEVITKKEEINLNKDSKITKIKISNSGDRPVQVGSHYHFYEVNKALIFDREITPVSYTHLTLPTSVTV